METGSLAQTEQREVNPVGSALHEQKDENLGSSAQRSVVCHYINTDQKSGGGFLHPGTDGAARGQSCRNSA